MNVPEKKISDFLLKFNLSFRYFNKFKFCTLVVLLVSLFCPNFFIELGTPEYALHMRTYWLWLPNSRSPDTRRLNNYNSPVLCYAPLYLKFRACLWCRSSIAIYRYCSTAPLLCLLEHNLSCLLRKPYSGPGFQNPIFSFERRRFTY